MNVTFKKLDDAFTAINLPYKTIDKFYPKIVESFMPLSITGVSPRTYFNWKEKGLVAESNAVEEERAWVRINLVGYLWLKIVQSLSNFGVPLSKIKEQKEMFFKNILSEMFERKEELLKGLESYKNIPQAEKDARKIILNLLTKDIVNSIPKEWEMCCTLMGSIIVDLLMRNDRGAIIVTKINNKYEIDYFSSNMIQLFPEKYYPLQELPRIEIPLRKLIEDFFDNPKAEKFIDSFELLNAKEKKVIDAIRMNDFKEIVIKLNENDKTMTIDVEKSGAIMDQKAKDVRRILGLNEYTEVTIKYRNDKHLYFKNKTRI